MAFVVAEDGFMLSGLVSDCIAVLSGTVVSAGFGVPLAVLDNIDDTAEVALVSEVKDVACVAGIELWADVLFSGGASLLFVVKSAVL